MRKITRKLLSLILAVSMVIPSGVVTFGAQNEETNTPTVTDYAVTENVGAFDLDVNRPMEAVDKGTARPLNLVKSTVEESYIPSGIMTSSYPAVRSQSPYGTCWAFSATALAELSVLYNEGKLIDLSELHTAYFALSYKAPDNTDTIQLLSSNYLNAGGDPSFVYHSYANWVGIAAESTAPYENAYDTLSNGLDASIATKDAVHLRNAYVLSYNTDKDYIKSLIKKYGGAIMMYYDGNSYYDYSTNSYYSDNSTSINHAVTIVGWDDDKVTTAPYKGAWLVRNSWGSNTYSHYGYFWMSYYEPSLSNKVYVFDCISDTGSSDDEFYDNNYQYDRITYSSYGSYGRTSVKTANVFTSDKNREILKAVAFETANTMVSYTVDIYTGITDSTNPESGTLVRTQTGNFVYSGYHTVKLKEPLTLTKGTKFSVVVTATVSTGKTAQYVAECSVSQSGYVNMIAGANAGESFVYNPYGYWFDFGEDDNANIRIKAFTDNVEDVEVTSIKLSDDRVTLDKNSTYKLKYTYLPEDADNAGNSVWSVEDSSVATVSSDGTITAIAPGVTTVKVTIGNVSETATVMVKPEVKVTRNGNQVVFSWDKFKNATKYTISSDAGDKLAELGSDATQYSFVSDEYAYVTLGITYSGSTSEITIAEYIPYNITYNLDGGTNSKDNPSTYYQGDAITLANPSKTGYVFDGWYKDATFTNRIYDIDTEKYQDTTIYAKWKAELGTPSIISAANASKGILIKWNQMDGADGYYIYRKAGTGSWKKIATISKATTVSYTDTQPVSGTTYSYAIKAYSGSKVSSSSPAKSVIRLGVTTITSVTNGVKGATLKWNKITGATGYAVYRKIGSGSWIKIATVKSETTLTYTDTTMTNGAVCSYVVRPISGSINGVNSPVKTNIWLTRAVINSCFNANNRNLTVKWNRNWQATSYQICYKTGTTSTTINVTGSATLSKIIPKLTKNKTYNVYVRSCKTYNGVNYFSAWSAVKTIKITK